MRARTLILLLLAVFLAGGTALLARSWLATERIKTIEEAKPLALPAPGKSVLVAKTDIKRGQIMRTEDSVWQIWPEGGVDKSYILLGSQKTPESYAGWVARNPISSGEPITESKIIAPGSRGFLAAVLSPGTRAISVPVTLTSGISGFIFPGDRVDLMMTYNVPSKEKTEGQVSKAQAYEHKAVETVLRDIRVIGIDQALEGKPGLAVPAHTATLEVTEKQTEVIILANEIAGGKLTLVLRSLSEPPPAPDAAAPKVGSGKDAALTPAVVTTVAARAAADERPVVLTDLSASGASSAPAASAAPAVAGDDKLAQAQPAKPGATPAPAPSGGPRVVSPPGKLDKKDTVGGKATYTLDNEISTLLPQPKGESDTPETVKLWVCKGPTLSCNIQTGESDGDKFLQAFQTLRSNGAVFTGPAGR